MLREKMNVHQRKFSQFSHELFQHISKEVPSELFVENMINWVAFVLNILHSFPLLWEKLLILHFGIVLAYLCVTLAINTCTEI